MPLTDNPILKILTDLDIDLMDIDGVDDYLRVLMEAINSLTIVNSKDARIDDLKKEIQRVREERKVQDPSPGMKETQKKITGSSISRVPQKPIVPQQPLVPQQPIVQQPIINVSQSENSSSSYLLRTLQGILDSVDGMLSILRDRQTFERNAANNARKKAEVAKRIQSEKDLESGAFGGLVGIAKRVLAPAISLWDRLWGFLSTILLGRVAIGLFNWFSDKENQKKVGAVGRFLKDWWPALLVSYLAFGNGLSRFIIWIVGKLAIWTTQLALTVIPALWRAILGMGPWGWAALGTIGLTGAAMKWKKDSQTSAQNVLEEQGLEEAPAEEQSEALMSPGGLLQTFTGSINQEARGEGEGENEFNEGGQVPGRGLNQDSVPAWLTPGEFVMSRDAVDRWGVDVLSGMNAAAGGSNVPSLLGGVLGLQGGGEVGWGRLIESGITPEARAWLRTINAVESGGPNKYNRLVGTEVVPELTEMTIQEIYDMAYGRELYKGNLPKRFGGREVTYGADSHATGAYQFHPDTMLSVARGAGMDPTKTIYSPSVQHRLALQHMRNLGIDPNRAMTPATLAISGSTAGWEGLSVPKDKITEQEALDLYNKMLKEEGKRVVVNDKDKDTDKKDPTYSNQPWDFLNIIPDNWFNKSDQQKAQEAAKKKRQQQKKKSSEFEGLFGSGWAPDMGFGSGWRSPGISQDFRMEGVIKNQNKDKKDKKSNQALQAGISGGMMNFHKGGEVKLSGNPGFKTPEINPPPKPTTTVAYINEMAAQKEAQMPFDGMRLPPMGDPSEMVSSNKIKTLGISV